MDLNTGVYYSLNMIGSLIWERLDGAITVSELVRLLTEEYDVTPERAMADVQLLMTDLLGEGLVF